MPEVSLKPKRNKKRCWLTSQPGLAKLNAKINTLQSRYQSDSGLAEFVQKLDRETIAKIRNRSGAVAFSSLRALFLGLDLNLEGTDWEPCPDAPVPRSDQPVQLPIGQAGVSRERLADEWVQIEDSPPKTLEPEPGNLLVKDFFISYNQADKQWAEWIAWTLEEAGYATVVEMWDFQPGGSFALYMDRAIKETRCIIAVLSKQFLNANYTPAEWASAFAKDPQGLERKLISMRVGECQPTGLLAQIVSIDLVVRSEDEAARLVLDALKERAKPAVKPTAERVAPERVMFPNDEAAQFSSIVIWEDPEGSVPLNSIFYINRPPIEEDCFERLVRPGALIRIKAPGQMGKTSLIERVMDDAKQRGYRIANVNFRSIDTEFWSSLDQFLQWFCASVTEDMERPDKLTDYWTGVLGAKNKSNKYFERYLLTESDSPLVLGLDNADEIFAHEEIARDFFGLLRTWHEQGKNEDVWKKLRLVIAHSKEVYIPLNMDQSPFNVGFATELRELNRVEVQELVQRHGLQWHGESVTQLMQLVGGHPYLLRAALYQIARQRMSLAELLEVASTEGGLYGEHLRHHYLNLRSDRKLMMALRQIVLTDQPIQVGIEEAFRLRSMGLVKYRGNMVMPLCGLYQHYFRDRLSR